MAQMKSIYRKLDSATRTQAVTRARELCLLEGCDRIGGFPPIRGMANARARGELGGRWHRRNMSQTVRFQETLRRLAIFDEGLAGPGFGPHLAGSADLDAKT